MPKWGKKNYRAFAQPASNEVDSHHGGKTRKREGMAQNYHRDRKLKERPLIELPKADPPPRTERGKRNHLESQMGRP